MHLLRGAAKHVVDSRPSDSIAIAVRLGAPIFAAEELLAEYEPPSGDADAGEEEKESGPDLSASSMEAHMRGAEQLKRHLERLRPEDFGKFTL
jgi:bifunctional DNase/RNase